MKILRILNSKIRYKLQFGFVFISLLVGVVGYIGFKTIRDIESGYGKISTESLPLIRDLEEMKFACLRLISSTTEYAYILAESKNTPEFAALEEENIMIKESCISCHSAFHKYEALVRESFPEAVDYLKEIKKSGILLETVTNEFLALEKTRTGKAEALEKKEEMEIGEHGFLIAMDHAIAITNARLEEEKSHLVSTISSSFKIITLFSVLTLLISLLFSILMSRSISKPIIELRQITDDFREGNLDAVVEIKSTNEIGDLGISFNEMAGKIKFLISQLEEEIKITRLAEEQIKLKNEQLQILNAEKDKFFSIIAHDLKGPLSNFVGVTQLMTEEILTMPKETIRDFAMSMKKSATNIYSLLENLLEWSRLRQDGMDFVPEKFNLKTKIEECIDVLSESARKKGIEISISIPDNIEVFADNHMFDTVIRNLVSNALKFTPSGGKVSVTADYDTDNSIEVKINDSGIGMTPELKSKLFLLNENTGRIGTEGETSSGLGLLLVKEFIEKHNGKISVESEVGKGSTFRFTIPVVVDK